MNSMAGRVIAVLKGRWRLLFELCKRDVVGKYSGSSLGIIWALVTPIALLFVYTWVFSEVFRSRWTGAVESKTVFALNVYCGMLVHGFFSEVVSRSVGAVVASPNYVKKVVFPLELLPMVGVGSSLFHALCGLVILVVSIVLLGTGLSWNALWLPLVWVPFICLCLAASFFLACLTVYLRDIAQVTIFISTLALFMSPVFYPSSALPEQFRWLLNANPLTSIIENTRLVLLQGSMPVFSDIAISTAVSLVLLLGAVSFFRRLKSGFADVL